ncbi:MAG: hypothetical protein PVF68_11870 [Acidobacteriota bacterium]
MRRRSHNGRPRIIKNRLHLLALVLVLAVPPSGAYPIRPVPLWDLVDRSDRIVLAQVMEEIEVPPPDVDLEGAPSATVLGGPGSLARLGVRETWKGTAGDEIRVVYNGNLICPAPPRYETGMTVIAFLRQTEDGWRTVGLSYGTLYPAAGEVDDFREMVKEAVRLQGGPPTISERRDWLVEAASRPGTRWHGLYELVPETDRLHSFYDPERKPAARTILSHDQLEKIARGFVDSPPTDRTLPMALAVLRPFRAPGLDEAAVSAVEALLIRDQPPWWIGDALEGVFLRYGDRHPRKRLEPLGDPFEGIDPKVLGRVWRGARKELLIPRVAPAEDPSVEVWGVGPDTPE